jgi:drug/metabolite transporter (DMT)-like permease
LATSLPGHTAGKAITHTIAKKKQGNADAMKGNLLGITATIGAGAFMISADVLARVALRELPLGEVISGRAATACLILGTAALLQGQLRWHPGLLRLPVLIRIMAEIGAGMFFVSALTRMPVANAAAILQFIPLVTTMAAAVLFAEHVGWRRWLAGFAGLIGVLLILKPGTDGFTWWSLLAVGAMSCMSTRDLATSRIERGLPTLLISSVSAAAAALSGLALMLISPWSVPSAHAASFLTASGIMLAAGFFCLVMAMRNAEMSAIAPFRYFTLLWALLIGYFAWGEIPDTLAVIGIAIVVGAGLYAFSRERVKSRLAPPRPVTEPVGAA